MASDYRNLLEQSPADVRNPYMDLLDEEDQDEKQRLRGSLSGAVTVAPDKFAAQKQVARYLGYPTSVVEALPDTEREAKVQSIDEQTANAPATRRKFTDEDFAKLAHDDVGNLTAFERLLRGAKGAGDYLTGLGTDGKASFAGDVSAGVWRANRGAAGVFQAGVEAIAPLIDPLAGTILPENPLRRMADALAGAGRLSEERAAQVSPAPGGIVAGGVSSGVQSLTQNILTLPATLANPAAGLTMMSGITGGQAYQQAREKGLGAPESLAFGASQAVIEYATEKIPVQKLIGDIAKDAGLAKTVVNQLAAELPGEQVATILQDLNEWAALNPEKPFAEYLKERPSAAAQTLIATIVGVGGNVVVAKGIDRAVTTMQERAERAARAEETAQRLEQMDLLAAASKVRQRDPETFEGFIRAAAEDGPVTHVYVSAETLAQSPNVEALAAVSPSIAAQLPQALATGGTVQIPIEEYATHIAGTELNQGLIDELRTEPDGFSRREAKEFMQSQAEDLKAEVEKAIAAKADDDTFKASIASVKDQIKGQLDATQRFKAEVNEAYATMVSHFFGVMGAKIGMSPEALFAQYPLKIAAESLGGRQLDQKTAFDWSNPGGGTREKKIGDTTITYGYDGNSVELAVLRTPQSKRGKGSARAAVEAFLRETDMLGVPVKLGASPLDKKTHLGKLVKFYQSLGFELTGKTINAAGEPEMIRPARAPLNQAPYTADTIEIDGKQRSTTDSTGRRIAETEEGLRNFWKWFGDSKVVDDQGRPLVVYHSGTFDENDDPVPSIGAEGFHFGTETAAEMRDTGKRVDDFIRSIRVSEGENEEGKTRWYWDADGIDSYDLDPEGFGTAEEARADAEQAAQNQEFGDADPMPLTAAYLAIANPTTVADQGADWSAAVQEAKAAGHDGIRYVNKFEDKNSISWIVFQPEQIKSAVGNRGTFDPTDANILNQPAYHGSPHQFDKFSTDAIGTGAKVGMSPEALLAQYPVRIGAESIGGRELDQGGLAEVRKQWADAGIENAVFEKNGTITLSQIVVPKGERGTGKGTAAMQQLVDYADRTGQRVVLSPSSDFGGNKKRLVEFYKRFGFVQNKGKNKDFTTQESMIRPARTPLKLDQGRVSRVLFRGTTGSSERIKGGIAEGTLFASADRDVAESYAGTGGKIEQIGVRPDAKILVEGSAEFAKVTGRRRGKLLNTMRRGENLKTAADEAVAQARAAGYDAVEFTSMRDLGIAVLNEDKFIRDYSDALNQSPYTGDTIEVDGHTRPTVNSNGQRIAETEEGLRAFWRWFGDSKVVDAEGRPLVVYHGGEFNAARDLAFDPAKDVFGEGFFFTPYKERALRYANGDESKVTAAYLRIENPDPWIGNKERLKAEGRDGVHDGQTGAWAAFDPEQIKSAVGNRGTFDPADANILNQPAYHGTPHRGIEKFSTDAIGTGEGAQAYGWGLYFASRREIAEHYRKALTPPSEIKNWRFGSLDLIRNGEYRDYSPRDNTAMAEARAILSENLLIREAAITEAFEQSGINGAKEIMREVVTDTIDMRDDLASQLRIIGGALDRPGGVVFDAVQEKGQVYEVEVPEDDTLLDWDKPLSEQPEKVRTAIGGAFTQYVEPKVEIYWTLDGRRLDPSDPDFLRTQRVASLGYEAVLAEAEAKVEQRKDRPESDPLRQAADRVLANVRAFAGREAKQITRELEVVEQDVTGQALYKGMERVLGSDKAASEALAKLGIKGIKYLDGGSRSSGDGTHNYVIFSGDDVAITNQFYQNRAQGNRGSFRPSDLTMTLLKGADLSTFLHESGHFFLEVQFDLASRIGAKDPATLTPGERELLADTSALLNWFGVPDVASWYNLDFEEQRSYHERFARGFESYLFEGKAPSIELHGLFQRFRSWLVNIYRELKNLNVELSDEVRGVFDRMLATNEQIQLAEQARSMMPLFESPDQAGMTVEEFAAYQALGTQATADAIEDLQARGLRDMAYSHNARGRVVKRLQKQAEELRRGVRAEVRTEVMGRPVYRAWAFLTGKMTADDKLPPIKPEKSAPDQIDPGIDSLFVAIAKLGGLRKAEVVSTWGTDPKDKPSSGVFGKPVWRVDGGRTIDDMAEALVDYGYLTPDENGKVDTRELEERFSEELRGAPQYSAFQEPGRMVEPRAGEQVANPMGLAAGRLDLVEIKGMGIADATVDRLTKLKMTAKNGLHPDLVADMFGFTSGDEMVRAILDATPPADEIEGLTDARMLQEHGELSSPDAIEREADRAVHNDVRARMVATEANALAKAVSTSEKVGTDKRGRPVMRPILPRAAREFAAAMIARLRIRDIRPQQYTNAEVRAAREAQKASQAGDLATAAAEKRNQLVNVYAARAAYDAQEEIDAALKYLRKFSSEGSRKGLDVDYLDQIDALLERFDLRASQSLKAVDKRAALAAWIESQREQGLEPDLPPELLNEAFRKSYKDMTVEEFRGLVDSVKQIEHLGRLKKKLLTAKDQREYEAVRDEIVARIHDKAQGRTANTRTPTTPIGLTLQQLRRFWAAHIKAATWARIFDGDANGPVWNYLIRPANDRADMETTMRAEATERLHEILAPIFKLGRMSGSGTFFPSINRSLNRQERIAIALNVGNEGNLQRLLGGEGWQMSQVVPVLKSLTAVEWQAVQAVWDHLEAYRPLIAEKERRVYGKEPEWVEPRPFDVTTADGQTLSLRGGYYPIKFDPAASQRAEQYADAEEAQRQLRGAYTSATTRRSFTKSRVDEVVGRPLLYNLSGLYSGVNDVIHDLAWHEWLIDANRLLRSQSIDAAIRGHYGPEAKAQLKSWVADVAEGERGAANAGELALGRLRQGVSAAGLGFNVMNAAMQPLGFTQSIVRVGATWVGRGIARTLASPLGTAKMVNEKSEFMRNRARTRFRELNELRNKVQDENVPLAVAKQGTYFLMMRAQQIVDIPTWVGAYEKAIADQQPEDRAVSLADQAVIDAQGGGQLKDLAAVERGGPALKLFTVFYSFMNTALNLGVAQTMTQRNKAKIAVDYLLLFTAPAILGTLLKDALQPGGDDDDEDLTRKLIAAQLEYLMGLMVVVREFGAVGKIVAGAEGVRDYQGPAGVRVVSDVVKLGQQTAQGEFDDAFRKAVVNVIGDLTGLPSAQVNKTITGAQALEEGETENPAALVFGYSAQ